MIANTLAENFKKDGISSYPVTQGGQKMPANLQEQPVPYGRDVGIALPEDTLKFWKVFSADNVNGRPDFVGLSDHRESSFTLFRADMGTAGTLHSGDIVRIFATISGDWLSFSPESKLVGHGPFNESTTFLIVKMGYPGASILYGDGIVIGTADQNDWLSYLHLTGQIIGVPGHINTDFYFVNLAPPPPPHGQAQIASFVWDPRGDDPEADHDDGREHPEERAIKDRDATHEEKWRAWESRAERLTDEGKILAAGHAMGHMEHHLGLVGEDDEP